MVANGMKHLTHLSDFCSNEISVSLKQHVFPFPSSSFFIVTVFSSFLFPTDYSSWIYRHAVDSFCPFACL
ncbi:hypothetical protein L1887_39349 [Cichorium endivia]|nr:hypothetical protein L1887_39349 [Cichorium endivia]